MHALTRGTNKHLLKFDEDQTVIERTVSKLPSQARVVIVTTPHDADEMRALLPHCEVVTQAEANGIADALNCARDAVCEQEVTCLLGDNLFEQMPKLERVNQGAIVYTAKHDDSTRFGVVTIDDFDRRVLTVEEKPDVAPVDCEVLTGLYSFDDDVWRVIDDREDEVELFTEFDMTYLLRDYAERLELRAVRVTSHWNDLGLSPEVFRSEQEKARQPFD
jgi:dTDP-glucose pyrophosphorylase